ncbi:MAG: hypothetical protein WA555_16935, partial [Candidatus Sulfotelmatobacter sp.]
RRHVRAAATLLTTTVDINTLCYFIDQFRSIGIEYDCSPNQLPPGGSGLIPVASLAAFSTVVHCTNQQAFGG